MARKPDVSDFDKVMQGYKSLESFIVGECCNAQWFLHHPRIPPTEVRGKKHWKEIVAATKPRRVVACIAHNSQCDIVTHHEKRITWRSPMSTAPGQDQPVETSGCGHCSWCEGALLPILPDQLVTKYQERRHDGIDTIPDRAARPSARRAGRFRSRARTR